MLTQENFGDIVQFGGVRTSKKCLNDHVPDIITRWRHLINYVFLYQYIFIVLYHFYIIIILKGVFKGGCSNPHPPELSIFF